MFRQKTKITFKRHNILQKQKTCIYTRLIKKNYDSFYLPFFLGLSN